MNIASRRFLVFFLLVLIIAACKLDSLGVTKPEEVGMSGKHLRRLDGIIKEAIGRRDFPGAVVLIGRRGKTVYKKAFGDSQWLPRRRPMEESLIFDLASLTKPIATATSIMILAEEGRISLEEKVKDYVPEFSVYVDPAGKASEDARIWHLLTHTSGLMPYTEDRQGAEVEKKFGRPCTTEQIAGFIAQLPKTDPPGTAFHYSCLGYITLAHILRKVTGQNVAEFSQEHIFKPLKMKHTFYKPEGRYLSLCVPTQVIDGKPLVGVVQDPLARLQGGISGNAGLFSTADDLAVFAQMMLNRGEHKGVRVLSPLTVARMTEVSPKASFAGRGLGWDLDSSFSTNSGELFGPHSYGHTGHTGTSIWIDPEAETFVIFLTNCVHPDDAGLIIAMRSRVANVVASSILDIKPPSSLQK